MAVKAVFLDERHIRALKILATMKVEELKLINENPELTHLYEEALTQLGRAQ
jgi:hypothetical protein